MLKHELLCVLLTQPIGARAYSKLTIIVDFVGQYFTQTRIQGEVFMPILLNMRNVLDRGGFEFEFNLKSTLMAHVKKNALLADVLAKGGWGGGSRFLRR